MTVSSTTGSFESRGATIAAQSASIASAISSPPDKSRSVIDRINDAAGAVSQLVSTLQAENELASDIGDRLRGAQDRLAAHRAGKPKPEDYKKGENDKAYKADLDKWTAEEAPLVQEVSTLTSQLESVQKQIADTTSQLNEVQATLQQLKSVDLPAAQLSDEQRAQAAQAASDAQQKAAKAVGSGSDSSAATREARIAGQEARSRRLGVSWVPQDDLLPGVEGEPDGRQEGGNQ